jgi:asparagine synthase (glutamine-hydrolysing)
VSDVYFHARARGDGVQTTGTPAHTAGQRLPGGDEGAWSEWAWDGFELKIRTDRFGFRPLFYADCDRGIAVSPSIARLLELGVSREVDYDALGVFLRLGFFLGEDTPFKAVKSVPPAASIRWTPGSLDVNGTISFAPHIDLRRDEAIEAYALTFRTAVERHAEPEDRIVHPLSGGRDSRHLLLELCAIGRMPDYCVTSRFFPPRATDDVEVAAALADAVGLRHVVLDQTQPQLAAERRKNELTGFCSDEHVWALTLVDHLDGGGAAIFDGLCGGVLSAGAFSPPGRLRLYREDRLHELADRLIVSEEFILAGMLTRDLYARVPAEAARERIVSELQRHAAARDPVGSFYLWNRSRREVALIPYCMLAPVNAHTPYLDGDVFELLAGLPPEHFAGGDFHSETIARTHPAVASVPYATPTGRGPVHDRRHAAGFGAGLIRYVHRHGLTGALDMSWLAPRLAKSAIKGRALNWFPMAAYVAQLEAVAAGAPLEYADG